MKPAPTPTDPLDQAVLGLINLVKANPSAWGFGALLALFVLSVAMTLATKVTQRK